MARRSGVERLDAQRMLGHLLGRSRAWLLAHDDAELSAEQGLLLAEQVRQRAAGVPLAYVLGEAEFCGLALHVTPDVLVPRPETELLVDWALQCAVGAPAPTAVDLGTGSGAVALALKQRCPAVAVTATDASTAALALARRNGARHALSIDWLHGDWWAPLAGRHFGLAVSNPPYVAGHDPHLAALSHEPRLALTPGADGLAALRRVVAGAAAHLLPGAWLLLEHGHDQALAVQGLLVAHGFKPAQTRCDLAGLPRCTGAARQGSESAH